MVILVCLPILGQTKRALLVGISDYPQKESGSWPIIHGANDVDLLSATLRKQGFETKLLTNKAKTHIILLVERKKERDLYPPDRE